MDITSMWNAYVEVELKMPKRGEVDADMVDQVMDALAEHHVAVSVSERGWAAARISLPATSLAAATSLACALVTQAYGVPAIAAEVMTESEFLAREGWASTPDMISVTDAAELLGVSRQAVLDRIKRHTLPATRVGSGKTSSYVIPRSAIVTPATADA